MYFLKRNLKTVILYMLSFGIVGTIVSFFLVGNTYSYEEYYSLADPLSTTQEDELSIQLNQTSNSKYDEKIATLNYSPESQYLQLSIKGVTSEEVSNIRTQFNDLLNNNDISYTENIDTTIVVDEQMVTKTLLILLSLILGLICGFIYSILDKRIRTDEDVEHYLNQKTIGVF